MKFSDGQSEFSRVLNFANLCYSWNSWKLDACEKLVFYSIHSEVTAAYHFLLQFLVFSWTLHSYLTFTNSVEYNLNSFHWSVSQPVSFYRGLSKPLTARATNVLSLRQCSNMYTLVAMTIKSGSTARPGNSDQKRFETNDRQLDRRHGPNNWCEQRVEPISYLGQRQEYRATGAVAHCHEELCMTSLSQAKLDCNKWCFVTGLDWIAQCFTSSPTQYRLYGRWFLQVKRPNQQYQSTEGKSTKDKSNNGNNTKHTCRDNNRDEKRYT